MGNRTDALFEFLKKPFYSDKEAVIDQSNEKTTTRTSDERQEESPYILYDPFASYYSSGMYGSSGQVALVRAQQLNSFLMRWREISHYPEVDEAISEIMSEAVVYDEQEDPIELNLEDLDVSDKIKEQIQDSFKRILFMLNFQQQGDDLFRQWYVDGQLNLEIVFNNGNLKAGIQKLILLTPFNLMKVKSTKDNNIYYFYNTQGASSNGTSGAANVQSDFAKAKNVFKDEQICRITSGIWSIDRKVPLSYLQKAVKPINQLYLIEDALIIYRITRAPEKRVFYIDTGRLPKTKAEEYVKSLIRKYRQQKIYDTEKGDLKDKPKSISILEDFWFPTNSEGKGTKVETLQGMNANFGDLEDLNYFVNKVFKALNVPIQRRGAEESRLVISSSVDIERSELKFFKFILKLRKRFNQLFIELLKRDIIAKKILSLAEWHTIKESLKFKYSNSNEFSTIKKLQIAEMRIGVSSSATSLMQDKIVSRGWIMRELMLFNEDEIKEIKKEIELEAKENEELDPEPEVEPEPKSQPVHIVDPDEEEPTKPKPKKPKTTEKPKAPVKPKEESPQPEGILKEEIIKSAMARLKKGDIVKIGDKNFKLEGHNIIEV